MLSLQHEHIEQSVISATKNCIDYCTYSIDYRCSVDSAIFKFLEDSGVEDRELGLEDFASLQNDLAAGEINEIELDFLTYIPRCLSYKSRKPSSIILNLRPDCGTLHMGDVCYKTL